MRKSLRLMLALIGMAVFAAMPLSAQETMTYEVTVTNLTGGQPMTPPILISHNGAFQLFKVGEIPGPALAELTETGSPARLADRVSTFGSVGEVWTGDGLIMPGQSATWTIEVSEKYPYLSFASMFAMTNDAFVGKRGLHVADGVMAYMNVWDAGSELNTELNVHVPGAGGMLRSHADAEGFVHIHPGLHGQGDLDIASRNWNNPGAMIYIKKAN